MHELSILDLQCMNLVYTVPEVHELGIFFAPQLLFVCLAFLIGPMRMCTCAIEMDIVSKIILFFRPYRWAISFLIAQWSPSSTESIFVPCQMMAWWSSSNATWMWLTKMAAYGEKRISIPAESSNVFTLNFCSTDEAVTTKCTLYISVNFTTCKPDQSKYNEVVTL